MIPNRNGMCRSILLQSKITLEGRSVIITQCPGKITSLGKCHFTKSRQGTVDSWIHTIVLDLPRLKNVSVPYVSASSSDFHILIVSSFSRHVHVFILCLQIYRERCFALTHKIRFYFCLRRLSC